MDTTITSAFSTGLTAFQGDIVSVLVILIPIVLALTAIFVGLRMVMKWPKKAVK